MAKLIGKFDDHHEYIWRCECHDWHFLELEWDEEDKEWRFLNIIDTWHPTGLRGRLTAAWMLLRGKPHYHSGIMLDEANVADILAVLAKHSGSTSESGETR